MSCLATRETYQQSLIRIGRKKRKAQTLRVRETMKSMSNDGSNNNDNNNSNNNNNNWLDFSLSPNMKMEAPSEPHHHHHHHQISESSSSSVAAIASSVPTSFFHSPPHFNYGIYYGVEGDTSAGLYSPLSMMPLKSDGSLCIMEALNRSQQPQG